MATRIVSAVTALAMAMMMTVAVVDAQEVTWKAALFGQPRRLSKTNDCY